MPFPNVGVSINGIHYRAARAARHRITIQEKSKTIGEFKTHDKDTGSTDVQVALLTHRINSLSEHLQKNNKDNSSRRGLLMMVSQRRRLLNYLQKTDEARYKAITAKLKLRK